MVRDCGWQRSEIQTLLLQHCAFTTLPKVYLTDGYNTLDQITRGRRSKRARSNCVLCIPFIFSGRPNDCWLHTCDACVITTWRLGLRAPLFARNYDAIINSQQHQKSNSDHKFRVVEFHNKKMTATTLVQKNKQTNKKALLLVLNFPST